MDTAAAAFPEQLKVFPSRKISTPVSKILRPARRGSALRRDALQRLKRERSGNLGGQQQSPLLLGDADRSSKQGQVLQQSSGEPHIYGGTDNFKKVGAVLGDASAPKDIRVAWAEPTNPARNQSRKGFLLKFFNGNISGDERAKLNSLWPKPKVLVRKPSEEVTVNRKSSAATEILTLGNDSTASEHRAKARAVRRRSRGRDSALRSKELEETAVKNVRTVFQKLYVPPLGPLDDPPGVIYLDGNLREKTVDVAVFEEVGKGVLEARKELFDIGTRRRSLVEEIKAQNSRVSSGFPRNAATEVAHERKIAEVQVAGQKAENTLKRLLHHRRRLLDVAKASQADDKLPLSTMHTGSSEINGAAESDADTSLTEGQATLAVTASGLVGVTTKGIGHGDSGECRRSSLEDMKELAKELMDREPAKRGRSAGDVGPVDIYEQQQPGDARKSEKRMNRKILNQGWREVFEAVFPEEGEKRRRVVAFQAPANPFHREIKRTEANIRGFLLTSTPREHLQFLITAMDPSLAKDFPSVVKCVIMHYTGPAADELDLLLGGRTTHNEAQALMEMSLEALENVQVTQVSAVLLLQWLLARSPHLRALLLRRGVLAKTFDRMRKIEAKNSGDVWDTRERAIQYGALALVVGTLFS